MNKEILEMIETKEHVSIYHNDKYVTICKHVGGRDYYASKDIYNKHKTELTRKLKFTELKETYDNMNEFIIYFLSILGSKYTSSQDQQLSAGIEAYNKLRYEFTNKYSMTNDQYDTSFIGKYYIGQLGEAYFNHITSDNMNTRKATAHEDRINKFDFIFNYNEYNRDLYQIKSLSYLKDKENLSQSFDHATSYDNTANYYYMFYETEYNDTIHDYDVYFLGQDKTYTYETVEYKTRIINNQYRQMKRIRKEQATTQHILFDVNEVFDLTKQDLNIVSEEYLIDVLSRSTKVCDIDFTDATKDTIISDEPI